MEYHEALMGNQEALLEYKKLNGIPRSTEYQEAAPMESDEALWNTEKLNGMAGRSMEYQKLTECEEAFMEYQEASMEYQEALVQRSAYGVQRSSCGIRRSFDGRPRMEYQGWNTKKLDGIPSKMLLWYTKELNEIQQPLWNTKQLHGKPKSMVPRSSYSMMRGRFLHEVLRMLLCMFWLRFGHI